MDEYRYDDNKMKAGYDEDAFARRSSGFGKGVMVGVLCTLLVVFLGGAAALGIHGIRQYVQTQEAGASETVGRKKSDSLGEVQTQTTLGDDLQRIMDKVAEIGEYVENDFLFDYDVAQMEEGIYQGLLYSLGDPYTYYYNEEEYAALEESYSGEYYGIGVLVSQDVETGVVTVLRVFDGPAKEAGIRKGDVIYRVEDLMVAESDLNTVVARLRGSEGTTVEMEIYRSSADEYITMNVERRQVIVEDVEYRMLDGQVGYILLDQFEGKAAQQLEAALDELERQGMEALVLDLRDNPGGDLNVMLDIADLFLDRGVVLTIEDVKGHSIPYYSGTQQFKKPLVVLVNGDSASASEALCGAIQDYERGILVGTQTFGKGIVQSIYTLEDGKTGLKLTTARYYTPGGSCIHDIGITPDVIVEQEDSGTDTQLETAVRIAREQLEDGASQ